MAPDALHSLEITTARGAVCPIRLGPGALEGISDFVTGRDVAMVGDATVLGLHGPRLLNALGGANVRGEALTFPAGERSKTRQTWAELTDRLLARGLGRDGLIIAMGGGVSLDLAGFVAATYMRGIPYISLPTSLLAQVDAAYGGKTGVNLPAGKNLLGAFHPPLAVLADPSLLVTLPPAEATQAMAEVIKHAVVGDEGLFAALEAAPSGLAPELLWRAVGVKARVVQADPWEAGLRRILNFGHTVGHAIERTKGYTLSHGLAVATGMMVEARLAQRLCGFPDDHVRRLSALLSRYGLPTEPQAPFEEARGALVLDKKNQLGRVHVALPSRIGVMEPFGGVYSRAVGEADVAAAWG